MGAVDFPDHPDPDGSDWMLTPLDGSAATYRDFVQSYYERDVDSAPVARVFDHEPLSQALLAQLGCERAFSEVVKDAEEIGYPVLL